MENVESLDMTGNRLLIVGLSSFPDQYRNLERLILRNTLLKVIVENAFQNLYNLRELDLSENLLRNLPPLMFANNELLERLNLSVNRIRRLCANQSALPNLRTLDISNGALEFVDDAIFTKLPALQWLNLRDNRLKTISLDNDISSVFLGGNPWNCDCGFLMLIKKVNETTDKNFTCYDTERSRRLWTTLSLVESDCKEKLESLKSAKRAERSNKTETSTELILDVYGYVLAGIAVLVIVCCYCCFCGDNNEEKADRQTKKSEIPCSPSFLPSGNQVVTDV
jgi:hypothetical protein